jgi:hypothetical protein
MPLSQLSLSFDKGDGPSFLRPKMRSAVSEPVGLSRKGLEEDEEKADPVQNEVEEGEQLYEDDLDEDELDEAEALSGGASFEDSVDD